MGWHAALSRIKNLCHCDEDAASVHWVYFTTELQGCQHSRLGECLIWRSAVQHKHQDKHWSNKKSVADWNSNPTQLCIPVLLVITSLFLPYSMILFFFFGVRHRWLTAESWSSSLCSSDHRFEWPSRPELPSAWGLLLSCFRSLRSWDVLRVMFLNPFPFYWLPASPSFMSPVHTPLPHSFLFTMWSSLQLHALPVLRRLLPTMQCSR